MVTHVTCKVENQVVTWFKELGQVPMQCQICYMNHDSPDLILYDDKTGESVQRV
jgi:hypothetical protein